MCLYFSFIYYFKKTISKKPLNFRSQFQFVFSHRTSSTGSDHNSNHSSPRSTEQQTLPISSLTGPSSSKDPYPEEAKRKRGPDKKPRKRGKEHGNYIHGLGKTREYNPKLYSAWIQGVLLKDGFQCFVTKETDSSKLTCHHLNGWDGFNEQRYLIENGITITHEIHRDFHKQYGFGQNTAAQFEQYLKENFQITEYPWKPFLAEGISKQEKRCVNHEPIFHVTELQNKQKTQEEKYKQNLFYVLNQRNHTLEFAEGYYSYSRIVVCCPLHSKKHSTTVTNYKKAKTGMPCCGKQIQDNTRVWDHLNAAKKSKGNQTN